MNKFTNILLFVIYFIVVLVFAVIAFNAVMPPHLIWMDSSNCRFILSLVLISFFLSNESDG